MSEKVNIGGRMGNVYSMRDREKMRRHNIGEDDENENDYDNDIEWKWNYWIHKNYIVVIVVIIEIMTHTQKVN